VEHIAIDLGARESQICVRNEKGELVYEGRRLTAELGRFLGKRAPGRVVLETSSEAFAVADLALARGHEVKVVPATLAPSLGVGARKLKSDQRDARLLSQVSSRVELGSVHIPSTQAREVRARCTARETLVTARTQLVNSTRGYLRTRLIRVRGGTTESFAARVRVRLERDPGGLPDYIESILVAVEALSVQIAAADQVLAKLAKRDGRCQRLMSVPGVGPVTSMRFVAAIDDVSRFEHAHALEAYVGLTPGQNSSGSVKRRTSITKAGSPRLRWALVQASWCFWRTRPQDPMVLWARQVAERRGKKIAIVALARKLAGVLYALLRDQSMYDPRHQPS